MFQLLENQFGLPAFERQVLDFWKTHRVFDQLPYAAATTATVGRPAGKVL